MYESNISLTEIIALILSIILIITFLIMAYRLKRIHRIIEGYAEIEFKKPEYQKSVICEQCGKAYTISVIQKNTRNCKDCTYKKFSHPIQTEEPKEETMKM